MIEDSGLGIDFEIGEYFFDLFFLGCEVGCGLGFGLFKVW